MRIYLSFGLQQTILLQKGRLHHQYSQNCIFIFSFIAMKLFLLFGHIVLFDISSKTKRVTEKVLSEKKVAFLQWGEKLSTFESVVSEQRNKHLSVFRLRFLHFDYNLHLDYNLFPPLFFYSSLKIQVILNVIMFIFVSVISAVTNKISLALWVLF